MEQISDNVMKIIFSFLDLKDHANLGNTCKWAHKVSTHPYSFACNYKYKLSQHHIKYLSKHSARVKCIQFSCSIANPDLVHLKSLVNLRSLDLNDCISITNTGLKHLKSLVNLQILDLGGCDRITDEGLVYLKSLVNLQSLDLYCCIHITDRGSLALRA